MPQKKEMILLVEDNPSISQLVSFKLKKHGYDVHHRANGKEGLEAILELKPDLVILDVMLPSMNGFEILRQMRQSEDIGNTKTIMLTSKNRVEDLEKGFNLKVEDYIAKPFKPAELIMRIEKALN